MTTDVKSDKRFLKGIIKVFQWAIRSMHEQMKMIIYQRKAGRDGNEKGFKKKFSNWKIQQQK